ncbi:MAG: PorV/PorQ family protein [Calditrichaeota bacterium]|nr:PorV/PorQ family protein [Calditrichota bacterium]
MKRVMIFLFIVVFVGALQVWSQDISRVGTAAGQFLKLGVGARTGALGEAAVTIPGEVTGLYWNPGTIATIDHTAMAFSRNELYADMSYNFIGVVQPLGGGNAIGVSAIFLNTGDMEITTLAHPEGTETYFNWQAYCFGLTYSRYVTDRLSLGGTIKYIREGAYHLQAHTIAIDLGSLLDTGILGMKMGMTLSNFGSDMRLEGPSLRVSHDRWPTRPGTLPVDAYLKTEKYPLPLMFRLGLSMELIGAQGQISSSETSRLFVAADVYDPNDALMRSNFGIEYAWKDMFYLRAGYRGLAVEKDEYKSYNTASYTFGGGLAYDLKFASFRVDYAFTDFQLLGSGHLFTLVLGF